MKARSGEPDAVGELLEPYRNYLRMLAAARMREALGKRVSASDIVQDAMLAAHQNIASFRGNTPTEFAAWMRTILTRCISRSVERNTKAGKRDIRREVSLNRVNQNNSSESLCGLSFLASASPTPSQIVSSEEEAVHIANLLAQLSLDYQQVIALRNFSNLRFDEIAKEMNRSDQAVRLLWLRAVRRLRQLYQESDRK